MSLRLNKDFRLLASRVLKKWGHVSQRLMMMEECAELIQVLAKVGRKINGSTLEDVIKELVDVEIMLGQLKTEYEGKMWTEIRDERLARLRKLLRDSR